MRPRRVWPPALTFLGPYFLSFSLRKTAVPYNVGGNADALPKIRLTEPLPPAHPRYGTSSVRRFPSCSRKRSSREASDEFLAIKFFKTTSVTYDAYVNMTELGRSLTRPAVDLDNEKR
jgi:hypothetical protein